MTSLIMTSLISRLFMFFFFEDALGKTTIQLESLHQTTQFIDFLGNYWRFDTLEVQMQSLSSVRFWFVKMIPLEFWVKNAKDADRLQTDEEGMKLIQKKTQYLEDRSLKRHLFTSLRDKVKMELELLFIWIVSGQKKCKILKAKFSKARFNTC